MLFFGRRRKFEKQILNELPGLFRLALRLTGNQPAAEDLVQETFLRALKAFKTFQPREFGLKPWLFKILHHIFFNERSAAKRHHILADEPLWERVPDPHPEGESELDIHHMNWDLFDEEIKRGVDALAPEYRVVLLLWALEQLTYQEIAHICGIPMGTVMSRLSRARKELNDRLGGYARSHNLIPHDRNHTPSPESSPNGI